MFQLAIIPIHSVLTAIRPPITARAFTLGCPKVCGQRQRPPRKNPARSSGSRRHNHHSQGKSLPARHSRNSPGDFCHGQPQSISHRHRSKTKFVYWGDVGPDAGSANPTRGPAGFDEVGQARAAGFFGWPYFIADNKAVFRIQFRNQRTRGTV